MDQPLDGDDLCQDCGACCQAFLFKSVNLSQEAFTKVNKTRDYEWVQENLVPISQEEVLATGFLNPIVVMKAMVGGAQYYKCNLYNEDSGLCMDHENRPQVCKEFPAHKESVSGYDMHGCKYGEHKFGYNGLYDSEKLVDIRYPESIGDYMFQALML